jgi:hypothetical protein
MYRSISVLIAIIKIRSYRSSHRVETLIRKWSE